MPAFFHEPLPDELLYSLVARYAAMTGLPEVGLADAASSDTHCNSL